MKAPRRRWTLRARLTVLYGGLFVVAGVALLGVTFLLVEQRLDARTRPDAGSAEVAAERVEAATGPEETVVMPDGRELTTAEVVDEVRREQEQLKQAALDSLLTQGGLALVGVGALAGAFGWLLAGRTLRPLHQITATSHRIASAGGVGRGLHERIALAGSDDEVRQLADTFDTMLEHLDRAFDGQRRFVANASHELRTPLALNRALVELAITRPDAAEETKYLGESLLTVNQRHERLIDGLLTLADSENAVTERTPVDLADVAGHVTELAASTTEEVEVRSTLAPAPTAGDPVLLERLTQNLVENAVRHNHPDGWLSVHTGMAGGRATLTVTNTGPTVPVYETETLFQPFRRLGDDRAEPDRGFGLGLSIVRAIARAHGGDATARPREGGGLTVTVTLPSGERCSHPRRPR